MQKALDADGLDALDGAMTELATARAAKLRAHYARVVAVQAGARDTAVEHAFATVPREAFLGPAPWWIPVHAPWWLRNAALEYVQTPDDDPAFVYADQLIALDRARGIHNGEPTLHARCLHALAPQPGETVLHVGAGTGYYSAILAELVGPGGRVQAFEIDPDLAARAAANLAAWPNVLLHARSGIADGLPKAAAVYVSAGITQPSFAWLDALLPGGRLLFPLQPEGGYGGMLLITKPTSGGLSWPARFVSRAAFIACQARQDDATGRALAKAFRKDGWDRVRSLRLDSRPDESCWCDGGDWWLSTAA